MFSMFSALKNRYLRLSVAVLLVPALLALPATASTSRVGVDEDDWSVSRVARCTYSSGDAGAREYDSDDWNRLETNASIFEGDELYAGSGARVELMLGARRFVRFGDSADVAVTRLDEDLTQVAVNSGTLTLSIEDYDSDDRIEINTPTAAVVPRRDGVYRVDLSENGDTWIAIRRGRADIRTPQGSFEADAGDLVSLSYDDSENFTVGRGTVDGYRDAWDRWTDQRDAYYADLRRRSHPSDIDVLYGRNDIYGIAELAFYGTWYVLDGHRRVWRPRHGVGPGWVPYRSGYWRFSPIAGWIWVSNEPWGWAPYHYGRWDYVSVHGWVWVPFDDYADNNAWRVRYRWRPALVHLWRPTGVDQFAWVPLAPGERFRRFDRAAPVGYRPTTFVPRHKREKRGVTVITPTALERRERPRAPVGRVKTVVEDLRQPDVVVNLPKPARVVPPTKALPTRVKPKEPVKRRPVVVDQQAAPKPAVKAPKVVRPTRKAETKRLDVTPKVVQGQQRTRELQVRPAPGKPRNTKAGTKVQTQKQPRPKAGTKVQTQKQPRPKAGTVKKRPGE